VYEDLDRPPLRAAALQRALVVPGGLWRRLDVVAETRSTNADLAARARAGEAEGSVLVAEHQSAGRGRLDRCWVSPARAGLSLSVLLRPADVPVARWAWLPLLAGLAVVSGVRRVAEVDAALKWPNDVLVGERKLAGILAERVDDAVVVGVGINVTTTRHELPVPTATSLALAGAASTDREPLLKAVLRALAEDYTRWRKADGDPESWLRGTYVERCATLGRAVRVELAGGRILHGDAVGVDTDGRLLVADGDTVEAVGAGDVVHVR